MCSSQGIIVSLFLLLSEATLSYKMNKIQDFLLPIFLNLILSKSCSCRSYDQHKQLMAGGKLVLSWATDQEMFHFRLSGLSCTYVGLAFSYNNLPVDAFVAGVNQDQEVFAEDLHLDYAGTGSLSFVQLKILIFFRFSIRYLSSGA